MKKRKGFTLIELLVVIGIIALLLSILMPALAKVRAIAYRMVCAANMGGVGKAMMAYANENGENYPVSGKAGKYHWSVNGKDEGNWFELRREDHFLGGDPTITSSLYLVIRSQDVTPKQFICKGDAGVRIFMIKEGLPQPSSLLGIELQNCWDFGNLNWPGKYNSYAYNMPFYHSAVDQPQLGDRCFPVVSSSNSGCPIMADRNPYNDKNADTYRDGRQSGETAPRWDPGESSSTPPIPPHYVDDYKTGNSACHQRDGQNVLFNDNRVTFEKYPNVGIDNDNIWKYWGTLVSPTDEQKQLNTTPPTTGYGVETDGLGGPRNERDAYLVSEDNRRQ